MPGIYAFINQQLLVLQRFSSCYLLLIRYHYMINTLQKLLDYKQLPAITTKEAVCMGKSLVDYLPLKFLITLNFTI